METITESYWGDLDIQTASTRPVSCHAHGLDGSTDPRPMVALRTWWVEPLIMALEGRMGTEIPKRVERVLAVGASPATAELNGKARERGVRHDDAMRRWLFAAAEIAREKVPGYDLRLRRLGGRRRVLTVELVRVGH